MTTFCQIVFVVYHSADGSTKMTSGNYHFIQNDAPNPLQRHLQTVSEWLIFRYSNMVIWVSSNKLYVWLITTKGQQRALQKTL